MGRQGSNVINWKRFKKYSLKVKAEINLRIREATPNKGPSTKIRNSVPYVPTLLAGHPLDRINNLEPIDWGDITPYTFLPSQKDRSRALSSEQELLESILINGIEDLRNSFRPPNKMTFGSLFHRRLYRGEFLAWIHGEFDPRTSYSFDTVVDQLCLHKETFLHLIDIAALSWSYTEGKYPDVEFRTEYVYGANTTYLKGVTKRKKVVYTKRAKAKERLLSKVSFGEVNISV